MVLSESEKVQLEAWYAAQDQAEGQLLLRAVPSDLAKLQAQLEATLKQISTTAGHIEELSVQNSVLRQEIAHLQRLLSSQAA
jgi:peptidoglycan hydrolase CwlO-like protein